MKKLFTDHVTLWILLLIGIAVAALTLAVVNSQRLKNAKQCQCKPPAPTSTPTAPEEPATPGSGSASE
ncbi:MAG: hypothetical protein K5867_04140 [Bacteroidales bacterium]|nr:hypothetical protein [Bacteroidales bacterium]